MKNEGIYFGTNKKPINLAMIIRNPLNMNGNYFVLGQPGVGMAFHNKLCQIRREKAKGII